MTAYLLVRVVLFTLRAGSFSFSVKLARFYLGLLDVLIPKLRHAANRNLQIAGIPDAARVIGGMWMSLARSLALFARFPSLSAENIHAWIRYEGLENYLAAKRAGRGVLFATAHLGNWELSAFAHALMTEPMNVVIRPLDNSKVDQLVEHRRTLSGNRIIGKRNAARSILRALRNNEAVGILIDQNVVEEEGVFIEFFGMRACAGSAFAKLAHHSGAAVIPGFAVWSAKEAKYILRFLPPVSMTGDLLHDTQAVHSVLEGVIRANPEQWLWIHRRWKTRPAGEIPLY